MLGCSTGDQTVIAEAAVAEFHRRLNADGFEAIYDSASTDFRKSAPREHVVRFLAGLKSNLGPAKSAKRLTWNVNFHTSGTFVAISYETRFGKGRGIEHFLYRMEDSGASLVSYRIESVEVIEKRPDGEGS